MLHFLLTKAEQCPQVSSVVVPVLLGDPGEVDRDKFFIMAKQMGIAERTHMVERLLFLRIQEREMLGPYPRVGHNRFGGVKAPIAENFVNSPRDFLRHCHDRGVVYASGERIG